MLVLRILTVIGALCGALGCTLIAPTPPGRPILYSRDTTIASRLLPEDDDVYVFMNPGVCRMRVPGPATLEDEILLMRGQIAAIIRVTSIDAELIENGSWIRTTVSALVERLIPSPDHKTLEHSIQFGFPGGTTRIGDVVVDAGIVPQYVEGQRYMVFLFMHPGINQLYPLMALQIDSRGFLAPMQTNAGVALRLDSHFAGQNAIEVADALARPDSKGEE
jgi:hypothetical protein